MNPSASYLDSKRYAGSASFSGWTGDRPVATLGTNAGSACLPFQGWKRFKEAFAPELIARAVSEHPRKVHHLADPFGGSGTTALAAQFLHVHPSTIEVNPYLADLIEAKLEHIDPSKIASELSSLLVRANLDRIDPVRFFSNAPKTFVEPGWKGRWIFNADLALEAASLVTAVNDVRCLSIQRLFKVLLGSALVELSNAVISGKGRRYRRGWEARKTGASDLRSAFVIAVGRAARDIARYAGQRLSSYQLFRGDSRRLIPELQEIDLAIYSPPYPNSFDYTDVYNIELWALGYLKSSSENRTLRNSTISSHVQLAREYESCPHGSPTLEMTLAALCSSRKKLWNENIPEMIGSYFAEMTAIIGSIASRGRKDSRQWIVVGDSRYAGIDVPVATILTEIAASLGLVVSHTESFRSMRSAPQQGGRAELAETLIVLAQ